jgi:SAM-dependent methyltransferase
VTTAVEAWERYAEKARPRREVNAAGVTTWLNWTQYPDHGPDESVLGDVRGRRVLELGSGTGCNLAHLATLSAHCVGVDMAPSRAVAAAQTWEHLPNLEFVTADALDYLATATAPFDVVYSIFGAVWFTDPAILLPLVCNRMKPGGVFAFSHLPAGAQAARSDRVISKWDLSAEHWVQMLNGEGFHDVTVTVIPAPVNGKAGTLLVRALAR